MQADQDLNHTTSHMLAAAVLKLFPETKLGFGPPIAEGFYYDFAFKEPLKDQDLKRIEKEMFKIAAGGYMMKEVATLDLSNQPYKQELQAKFLKEGRKITYYALVNPANKEILFADLCRGGHAKSVGKIRHFKLLSLAGAYWHGDAKKAQLTRIYGTSWATKAELTTYLAILEERKARDHRRIGKALQLFTFEQLAGQGFPIWLPHGTTIRQIIRRYIEKLDQAYGFQAVETPAFGALELYQRSGHWDHYQAAMFPPLKVDNETLVMRPMTCPHHLLIFNAKQHSYRDFPIRYSEQAQLYRYEKSGALTGIERTRAMLLTEGHVFVRQDQISHEIKHLYQMITVVLKKFQIKIAYVSLSLRDQTDRTKYYEDDKMWEQAETSLRTVLDQLKIPYQEQVGEAAFYGPKLDFQVKTALGHEITMSTLQLDFLLPLKFKAQYVDHDGTFKTPVLIHRGLIGTYERFIAILIEQTKGDLPFWLAPQQIVVIPVHEDQYLNYAQKIVTQLRAQNFRVTLDARNERLNRKIREAQLNKVKYQLVLGAEEIKNQTITYRQYGAKKQFTLPFEQFLKKIMAKD